MNSPTQILMNPLLISLQIHKFSCFFSSLCMIKSSSIAQTLHSHFNNMHFTNLLLFLLLTFFLFGFSQSRPISQAPVSRTITVDQSGHGDFTTVQQAIDSVPSNNKEWVQIKVKAGVYNEKVKIPRDKQFIAIEGESRVNTIIQWGDAGNAIESSTFILEAENFVARNLAFKNTYKQLVPRENIEIALTWAPAALIGADKASFYRCTFSGLQDTLTDSVGRHYFESCHIEGAIDFIWGGGQSIYQDCHLNLIGSVMGGAKTYITAQARKSINDTSGFVFNYGSIEGTGSAYLGRAYDQYSRVLFHGTKMANIIVPEGWDSWRFLGKEGPITYSEDGCMGPGANMSKRVKWEKNLTRKEWNMLTNIATFINQDGWLEKQPKPMS